jgi:hypothetical protein
MAVMLELDRISDDGLDTLCINDAQLRQLRMLTKKL